MSADKRKCLLPGSRVTQAAIRKRGWTQKMIDSFLGPPDVRIKNHHHPDASAIKLYDSERVSAVEATHEWAAAMEASIRRARSGKAPRAPREMEEPGEL